MHDTTLVSRLDVHMVILVHVLFLHLALMKNDRLDRACLELACRVLHANIGITIFEVPYLFHNVSISRPTMIMSVSRRLNVYSLVCRVIHQLHIVMPNRL